MRTKTRYQVDGIPSELTKQEKQAFSIKLSIKSFLNKTLDTFSHRLCNSTVKKGALSLNIEGGAPLA